MIDRLVSALREADRRAGWQEVAEVLWLAEFSHDAVPNHPALAGSSTEATDPGSIEDTRRRPNRTGGRSATEADAPLYPDTASVDDTGPLSDALKVGGPRVAALRGSLALGRALRPLRRRVPSHHSFELDESASAERIAEDGIWLPVWRPVMERRYRASIVIDSSASMMVWRRTVTEFRTLLQRVGAFRTIHEHTTDTDAPAFNAPAVVDPTGRNLIIVVTDGVGAAWGNGRMAAQLGGWAATNTTQVINLLPRRLWRASGLRTENRVGRPGNVSVIELSAADLAERAQQIAADEPVTGPVLVPPRGAADPLEPSADPIVQVQQFLHQASPTAQRLANCLAAAPLTLPVMRLVQHVMLPQSATAHLAEVFVSGLLTRRTGGADPELTEFDFRPGVRDLLLDLGDRYDTVRVLAEVSRFVSDRLGQPLNFPALLAHPDDVPLPDLAPGTLPFARISASALRRLGPRYTGLADRLEEAASQNQDPDPVIRPTQSTEYSDAIEGYPLSGSGTRAVFIGVSRYKHLTPLPDAAPDVKALAHILISRYHLREENARIMVDPTRRDMLYAIRKAASEAEDLLIICYSGHSLSDRGEEVLAAANSKPGQKNSLLATAKIGMLLGSTRARQVLLILESGVTMEPPARRSQVLSAPNDLVSRLTRHLDWGIANHPAVLTVRGLMSFLGYNTALNESGSIDMVFGPNPQSRQPFVYISYARTDRDYVGRLATFLQEAGIPVWYEAELRSGEEWLEVLESRLADCGALLVVLSDAAARSDWVDREQQFAAARGKPMLALLRGDAPSSRYQDYEVIYDEEMPGNTFVRRLQQLLDPLAAPGSATTEDRPVYNPPTIDDDAPEGPVFFLSYARNKNYADDSAVQSLFADLTNDLAELMNVRPEQIIGFTDTSVETGSIWEREILRAVGTCQVFVPLLSEHYLQGSRWCAMEWDAFSRRKVRRRPGLRSSPGSSLAILPVLWAPILSAIPAKVSRIHRFSPTDVPPEYMSLYQSEGLLGVREAHRETYRAMVWKLAMAIRRTCENVYVEPYDVETTAGLRRSFRDDLP